MEYSSAGGEGEPTIDPSHNMSESHRHNIERKKPDLSDYILHVHTRFYLGEVQEQVKRIYNDRSQNSGCGLGGEGPDSKVI